MAVVHESVESVESGPTGIEIVDSNGDPCDSTSTASSQMLDQDVTATGTIAKSPADEESPLRQRLRQALSKASNG